MGKNMTFIIILIKILKFNLAVMTLKRLKRGFITT